ncbi:protein unc-45 homolog B-like isoform X2 [Anneissia japonica]|uniref:protein unc-45 homolog B-like isoform X2 n=1 Tax=Anneissia japonica TaxID=1529436 RepID=UPI0014254B3C|nr:protein unc-45 homolog B-like isoform X2 [Anneissia japonica]
MAKENGVSDTERIKQKGNDFFKAGKYDDALACYTEALKLSPSGSKERAVFFKNRSACHLKLEKYEKAAQDASSALDIEPADIKALFRKCLALEKLEKHAEAYKEARRLIHLDPKNTAVQSLLQRLTVHISQVAQQTAKTDNKVSSMFDALSRNDADNETRRQAANNLIVLARQPAGAEKIFRENGVSKLQKYLDDSDEELVVAILRILSCLCTGHHSRALAVVKELSLPRLGRYIGSEKENICTAAAHVLFCSISSMLKKDTQEPKGAEEAVVPDLTGEIKDLMMFFLGLLNDKDISGYGRDAVIDIIIKFLPRKEGTGRAMTFITNGGLTKLLIVAGQIPELEKLHITKHTLMHASVALSKIYDEMISDKKREYYREICEKFIRSKFSGNSLESNLEAIQAISALLQGPYDVGHYLIGQSGVIEVMIAMATSADPLHQRVAVEAIVHSASKKDKCAGIISKGANVLKELYKSASDQIKVRALVGLAKLGSYGGSDYSAKVLDEGSTLTLAKQLRKFLVKTEKDHDLRKWAAEGLSYLSLDADVKETITSDSQAVKSLIELAKTGNPTLLYSVASTFVNLTNSYDQQKADPEMVKLAKFAKQHIPEDHPLDSDDYVKGRVDLLLEEGIVTGLVSLSKTESESSRELICRVFLACVMDENNRGLVVQQGGAKSLVSLANEGNLVGRTMAAQALAKIGITMNPEVAFPGQRMLEVVRPLIALLHMDCTGLQNFESLMALTNLASVSESVRNRIVKERGIPSIENYMFEEHDMIRRAATECMCNMIQSDQVFELFLKDNDKVKLLTLLAGEEDLKLKMAASGALAMLSTNEIVCNKILMVNSWMDIMQESLVSQNVELLHRTCHTLANIVESNKLNASKIVETSLLEILMALSKDEKPEMLPVRNQLDRLFKKAVEFELIRSYADQV